MLEDWRSVSALLLIRLIFRDIYFLPFSLTGFLSTPEAPIIVLLLLSQVPVFLYDIFELGMQCGSVGCDTRHTRIPISTFANVDYVVSRLCREDKSLGCWSPACSIARKSSAMNTPSWSQPIWAS